MVKYNKHMGNNHRETDKQKRPHENACHDEIIILRNIKSRAQRRKSNRDKFVQVKRNVCASPM